MRDRSRARDRSGGVGFMTPPGAWTAPVAAPADAAATSSPWTAFAATMALPFATALASKIVGGGGGGGGGDQATMAMLAAEQRRKDEAQKKMLVFGGIALFAVVLVMVVAKKK